MERGELRVHGELIASYRDCSRFRAEEILGIRTPAEDRQDDAEQTRLWKKFSNRSPLGPIRITRRHSHHQSTTLDKSAAVVTAWSGFVARASDGDLCGVSCAVPGGDSPGLGEFHRYTVVRLLEDIAATTTAFATWLVIPSRERCREMEPGFSRTDCA